MKHLLQLSVLSNLFDAHLKRHNELAYIIAATSIMQAAL